MLLYWPRLGQLYFLLYGWNLQNQISYILLAILLTLSTLFNAAFVICNILGKPNATSRTVLMNIDALYLTPQVVTSKPQFKNTFSAIATRFPICYLSLLKHLDMNAIVLGKQVRRTSFIKPKPSSLWVWTNVTNYDHYVIFILFSVNFLSSHTLPGHTM